MTPATFTRWEQAQPMKYEFVDGKVLAVYRDEDFVDVSPRWHDAVARNVYALLKSHLRDTTCRAYIADMQVQVAAAGNSVYPDVVVSCEAEALSADLPLTLTQPKVIVEVLSPTTANYDRSEKFNQYRLMPSLLEYVLMDPSSKTIDIYRRQPSGDWLLAVGDGEIGLILPTLNFSASRAAVFEDV